MHGCRSITCLCVNNPAEMLPNRVEALLQRLASIQAVSLLKE